MKRYGWFEFEKSPGKIVNYLTGQKLTILSGSVDTPFPELECEYSDNEIKQALRIQFHHDNEVRKQFQIAFDSKTSQAELKENSLVIKRTSIQINYATVFPASPSYGYWRRLDDFLTDALSCWHLLLDQPEERFSLTTIGGWRNGEWDGQLKRSGFGGCKALQDAQVAEPYVHPLNVATPKRWHYIDIEKPAQSSVLKFRCEQPLNIPYVAHNEALVGFQGEVPYLEREDKLAYIFPMSAEYEWGHGGANQRIWYTYVDQDIFFNFSSHSPYSSLNLHHIKDYGFRQRLPSQEFWAARLNGGLIPYDEPRPSNNFLSRLSCLSYPVWRRAVSALVEAWPMWRNPPRKFNVEPSPSMLAELQRSAFRDISVGDYGPAISGGYCAGFLCSSFELRFPLDRHIEK